MASMINGNLVEAYVLKNASKQKMKKEAEAANASGDDSAASPAAAENKKPEASKGKGGGFLGLAKKVHPKVNQGGASS